MDDRGHPGAADTQLRAFVEGNGAADFQPRDRGVRSLYYDPEVAAGELAVYFLYWNFRKWRRNHKDKVIGAVCHGGDAQG